MHEHDLFVDQAADGEAIEDIEQVANDACVRNTCGTHEPPNLTHAALEGGRKRRGDAGQLPSWTFTTEGPAAPPLGEEGGSGGRKVYIWGVKNIVPGDFFSAVSLKSIFYPFSDITNLARHMANLNLSQGQCEFVTRPI